MLSRLMNVYAVVMGSFLEPTAYNFYPLTSMFLPKNKVHINASNNHVKITKCSSLKFLTFFPMIKIDLQSKGAVIINSFCALKLNITCEIAHFLFFLPL